MVLSNPLTERLLGLGLKGMAEALDEQRAVSDYADLDFDDRLSLLLERETLQRSNRSYQARLRQAQLRMVTEVADVLCGAHRGLNKTTLLQFAACNWVRSGVNLIVVGKTGVGKTFLSCALANQACRQNRSVLYCRVPELVATLSQSRLSGSHEREMKRLKRVDLLVLDDWGLQSFSADGRRDLLEVVEYRNMRKSTLISSQVPVSQWHELIGEGTIADAILDRLIHYAHTVELSGESQRKLQKPPALDADAAAPGVPLRHDVQ